MGYGDDLMSAGHAEREAKRVGAKVQILNRHGITQWSELWEGNPYIARPGERAGMKIVNGPGARPYIKYPFTSLQGHGYTEWRARDHRGSLYLTEEELALGVTIAEHLGNFIVIEPNVKPGSNPNKKWPFENWEEVVEMLRGIMLVQIGPVGTKRLENVEFVCTNTFREGAGVLAAACCLATTEGGLHHAAAVLGIPAVVIFGGSCSEQATGYPDHVNLGGDDPCGRWSPCEHCAEVMESITPKMVALAVKHLVLKDY